MVSRTSSCQHGSRWPLNKNIISISIKHSLPIFRAFCRAWSLRSMTWLPVSRISYKQVRILIIEKVYFLEKRKLLVSRSGLLSTEVGLLSHSQVGLELLVHLLDDALSFGQSDCHFVYLILLIFLN